MTTAHITWLQDDGSALDATLLPTPEQAEMQQLASTARQRRFFLSRLMLRRLLATHLPPGQLHFSRADSGRLLLAGDTGWHISLSHAASGIAVIVSQSPCGIDIEPPRPAAIEKVAARYFSEAEKSALQAAAPAERLTLFFRLWTLKEASVKALGEGLAGNMSRLAFDVSQPQPTSCTGSPPLQLWQHYSAPHWLAAAVHGTDAVQWQVQQSNVAKLLNQAAG